jgi:hypothetical protein
MAPIGCAACTEPQCLYKGAVYLFTLRSGSVEALRYELEGRGLDSRRCHWNTSLTLYFRPHYDSTFNRNEHQEYYPGWDEAAGTRAGILTTFMYRFS